MCCGDRLNPQSLAAISLFGSTMAVPGRLPELNQGWIRQALRAAPGQEESLFVDSLCLKMSLVVGLESRGDSLGLAANNESALP
jgi:hypothetical protein